MFQNEKKLKNCYLLWLLADYGLILYLCKHKIRTITNPINAIDMKKKLHLLGSLIIFFALLSLNSAAFADIVIKSGSSINVSSGSSFVVSSNVTIESTAEIDNSGTVILKGNLTNNGTASLGTGLVKFEGTTAQEIGGSSNTEFGNVEINNANGLSIATGTTATDLEVTGTLTFTSGQFDIEGVNLTYGDVAGFDASSYIVMSGAGLVTSNVGTSSSQDFPIGYSSTNYNPVVIANPDVASDFTVYVADGLLDECSSGSEITDDVVTVRWGVTPADATEADLTLNWNASDEDASFDNSDCSIIHCEGGGEYSAVGGFGDGSSYSLTGVDITDFSEFGVGDDNFSKIYLDLNIMLAGPYAGGGVMNTTLRDNDQVPTDQPYSAAKYDGSHLDYDGTESLDPLPAAVVDWVLLELRTGTAASTSVGTVAALLLSDGSVAYYGDGSSAVAFSGDRFPPGDYYLAVHHRNHLSVLSSTTISLNRTSAASFDFTTGAGQFYTDGGISNAPANSNAGVYMMWAGDANHNTTVRYNGANKDLDVILIGVGVTTPAAVLTDLYHDGDVNMNNELRYNGAGKDNDVVLITVGVSTPAALVDTHVPF